MIVQQQFCVKITLGDLNTSFHFMYESTKRIQHNNLKRENEKERKKDFGIVETYKLIIVFPIKVFSYLYLCMIFRSQRADYL